MTNLIPEQRPDRNGKLVTRHVRATPKQGAERSAMPQPTLGAKGHGKTASKAFKPRASQLQQEYWSYPVFGYDLDIRLYTPEDREFGRNTYYGYTASEVEAYEVLSVAPIGAALLMLTRGIRTADEARDFMREQGVADLILDRSALVQEALEKNVKHFDFVEVYEQELNNEGRASEHLVDALIFSKTSLNHGMNSLALSDILTGEISYQDIKAVGVTKLKPHNRLSSLLTTFRKLHRGEGDYTIDGIKELIQRSSDENLESRAFNYVCRAMDHLGQEEVLKVKNLNYLANEFHSFKISPGASRFEDGIERALYEAKFREGTGMQFKGMNVTNDYYEGGIPVEVAIDVALKGGTAREAQAIHNEGIESGLSGGWL